MSNARNLADLLGTNTQIQTADIADGAFQANKNLVINGAMNVNQYGSSSTASGRQTVDRFFNIMSTDATITQSKTAITSGSPYDEGFRNVYKHAVTTASSSPASSHYLGIQYKFEAQDVAQSGWQYTSASSSITLSFWVKSSVAGTYVSSLRTDDGTKQDYSFEYTLTANTWKKVTKTFIGDSDITINDDTGIGLYLYFWLYLGGDFTDSSHTYNTWANYDGTSQAGDYAQNWMTTASATFDITGVQLELGSQATPFEHRSFADELARCQRYYVKQESVYGSYHTFGFGTWFSATRFIGYVQMPVPMRTNPSLAVSGSVAAWQGVNPRGTISGTIGIASVGGNGSPTIIELDVTSGLSGSSTGSHGFLKANNDSSALLEFNAEL